MTNNTAQRQSCIAALAAGVVQRWRRRPLQVDSPMWRMEGRWCYLTRSGAVQTVGIVEVRRPTC